MVRHLVAPIEVTLELWQIGLIIGGTEFADFVGSSCAGPACPTTGSSGTLWRDGMRWETASHQSRNLSEFGGTLRSAEVAVILFFRKTEQ